MVNLNREILTQANHPGAAHAHDENRMQDHTQNHQLNETSYYSNNQFVCEAKIKFMSQECDEEKGDRS